MMPKKVEMKLMKKAKAKHLSGKALGAYVYGIMRKTFGWKPKGEK